MKALLVFGLLACGLQARAQAPLPLDSASNRVMYRGAVAAPGATADALFARAKSFALTSAAPSQVDVERKTISGIWERPVGSGRSLRYVATVRVMDGRYSYELTDFENKTANVLHPAGGVLATASGGTAPLERVLNNPDGYRKGKPTAALLAYRAAVGKAAEQAVADLQQRMKR